MSILGAGNQEAVAQADLRAQGRYGRRRIIVEVRVEVRKVGQAVIERDLDTGRRQQGRGLQRRAVRGGGAQTAADGQDPHAQPSPLLT